MRFVSLCCMSILVTVSSAVYAAELVRPASAAGTLYPADAQGLRDAIRRCLEGVPAQESTARLLGCVVPHSGYGLCGPVIAHAFKELQPGQYDRVVILAASHYFQMQGCSIPAVQAFDTPLGAVFLDNAAIEKLCYSPYISAQALHRVSRNGRPQSHEKEYSVEVLLPFLQERLGQFKLVPILVCDFSDSTGKPNEGIARAVCEAIQRIVDERTLVIASSDLTPFGEQFGFKPFKENPLDGVERLDQDVIDFIVKEDWKGLRAFFKNTGDPICGRQAIEVLLRILPSQAKGRLLKYEQSGRLMKREDHSIGFAAINFYDPAQPPLAPRPQAEALSQKPSDEASAPAKSAPVSEAPPSGEAAKENKP